MTMMLGRLISLSTKINTTTIVSNNNNNSINRIQYLFNSNNSSSSSNCFYNWYSTTSSYGNNKKIDNPSLAKQDKINRNKKQQDIKFRNNDDIETQDENDYIGRSNIINNTNNNSNNSNSNNNINIESSKINKVDDILNKTYCIIISNGYR
ncbi:hypothetical protein PPL_06362 [Heterostelium album PN500]|uniref:Uncharacterized protein n=1 Tax=Heterostelium pallidum (strain ATCC 26659 / Pp 5 / PN500) TaxID=670386 RepID=D3BCY4_HETP5|nr:hypothetical protein PPL_06362 [Heterostelium album PN500]EFA80776.1 hypothetical protein PPL_06362 [Heterostelium album PN500]|eukprot:XP_020432895.1 hypothetical protein PPL_06362 [Heterostelium album PN500]